MTREQFDQQFKQFQEMAARDPRFEIREEDALPCLTDDVNHEGWDFMYAMHCGWACRVLMETKPREHVDVGSLVYFAAMASAIVPNFRYLDIRPIHLPLPGLSCEAGSLLNLPFADGSIKSLSCLHVIEHVGLGRYGDPLDPLGDVTAAKELKRVLAPGGQLLLVTPINKTPRIQFNADRAYTFDMVLKLFPGLVLKEFATINPKCTRWMSHPARIRDVAPKDYPDCGCFLFTKTP